MNAPSDPIIRLERVSKRFGSLVVLDDVSLDIARGRTTAIIGPSGAGKSVTLKLIVGLLDPDAGHVWIDGTDMTATHGVAKENLRKRFGMLFQGGALFDSLSAGENVAFPLAHHTRLPDAERKRIAIEKLSLVGLPDIYDRPTPALSGGQRKRVALARAIVMQPEVVLFDEPNSGLDPLTSETIDELIGEMKTALGCTFIVITHDIVSAAAIADDIAMIYDGKIVANGPTREVVRSEVDIVQRFLARNMPDIEAKLATRRDG